MRIFVLVFLVYACSLTWGEQQSGISQPGGATGEKPVTKNLRYLIQRIHPEITMSLRNHNGGLSTGIYKVKPISYRTQLVNGVNYFVKVLAKTGSQTEYYHLRIFKGFDGTVRLMDVEGPKLEHDPITYF